jgi:hypothetical protein
MSKHAARPVAGTRGHFQIDTTERAPPEWLRPAMLASPGIATLYRLRNDAKHFDDPFAFVDLALRELQVQL